MHVTKYHLSRFPPVKQMSGYWSVHAIAQGPRLEFPVALKKASSSLVPGLYPVSARGLCAGGWVLYTAAWLLQARHKILWISVANFRDSSAHTAPLEAHQPSAICSQSSSPLPIVLSGVINAQEDFITLGTFWPLSSSAQKLGYLCIRH